MINLEPRQLRRKSDTRASVAKPDYGDGESLGHKTF